MTTCPFCGQEPFHYENNGYGMEAVAVVCCDLGDKYFRGMRPDLTDDVVMDADTFNAIGAKIDNLQWQIERRDRIISKLLSRRHVRAQIDRQ